MGVHSPSEGRRNQSQGREETRLVSARCTWIHTGSRLQKIRGMSPTVATEPPWVSQAASPLGLKKEKELFWASLVAQWLRIRLPMQETRVRALVQEDPTCRGATKPVHHHY